MKYIKQINNICTLDAQSRLQASQSDRRREIYKEIDNICTLDLKNLAIISHVSGCDYKFGLFPKADGCQSSYIKCEHGTPTEVGQQTNNT